MQDSLSGGRFGYSQIQNFSNKIDEIDIQKNALIVFHWIMT